MRKAKLVLTLTLLIVVSMSTLVYARSVNERGNLRGTTYSKRFDGNQSVFFAVGQVSEAYSTIVNSSTYDRYLQVYTRAYIHGEGWQPYEERTGIIQSGRTLESVGIVRDMNSDIHEYAHSGKCSISPYYSSTIDDYMFVGDQYYD